MTDVVDPCWGTRVHAAAGLTQILGRTITTETLANWVERDPTCPIPAGRAPIPVVPLTVWALAKGGPGRPSAVSDPARDRAAIAQAKIWEAKAKKEDDRWVLREEVEADGARAVEALRRRLADAASRAGVLVAGKPSADAASIIGVEIGAALDAAAGDLAAPAAKAAAP